MRRIAPAGAPAPTTIVPVKRLRRWRRRRLRLSVRKYQEFVFEIVTPKKVDKRVLLLFDETFISYESYGTL